MSSDTKNISSIIEDISNKFNSIDKDNSLIELRDSNLKLYYNLDISFLSDVDAKYKDKANVIYNKYKSIDNSKILSNNKEESDKLFMLLTEIDNDINKLKEVIKSDLNTVIDYVDRVADKIDISNITKENPLGILILNKYDAFKIYSADLDLSNLNSAMKKQARRLMYLKELDYLINSYNNTNCKYNRDNTSVLINNLYEIVGRYLYLLTESEFEYTKEAIKKILAYKFDFVDKYLPTYKVILTKIWNSKYTQDYYFICNLDLDKDNIYLMNKGNIECYEKSGYICDIPKNFISYFNMDNMEVIKYPLPNTLNDKYELEISNFDKSKVNLKAMYTTLDNVNFKSILPIIKIK